MELKLQSGNRNIKIQKERLVYIAAASHSGSTLTAMLLGAHPDLCTVGELNQYELDSPDQYLCSCKAKVIECSFWSSIANRMEAFGEPFDVSKIRTDYSMPDSYLIRRIQRILVRSRFLELSRDVLLGLMPKWRNARHCLDRRNLRYVKALREETGAYAVVDSSKVGLRLKYIVKMPQIDLKVIWVTRDARGVALAYKDPGEFADARNPALRGGGTGTSAEAGRAIDKGALEWMRCNQETQAILDTLPVNHWMHVRYEDLCEHTEDTLDRLFNFIGVDPVKKNINFRAVEHHVIGNGMRLDDSSEIKLDDSWRHRLSSSDQARVNTIAQDLQRKMGYIV